MPTMAFILMTQAQRDEATGIDTDEIRLGARQIDNPLANNLGQGTIVGHWVAPARLLNDPSYEPYHAVMGGWPIHTWDSDVLFVPPPPEEEA